MPKIELDYVCKNCKSEYPASVTYSGEIEDLDLEENESRCPFCGTWNCADTSALRQVMEEGKKEKAAKKGKKKV
jgi:DNA-directed RNA polymerase subunit RPC12/RpoP